MNDVFWTVQKITKLRFTVSNLQPQAREEDYLVETLNCCQDIDLDQVDILHILLALEASHLVQGAILPWLVAFLKLEDNLILQDEKAGGIQLLLKEDIPCQLVDCSLEDNPSEAEQDMMLLLDILLMMDMILHHLTLLHKVDDVVHQEVQNHILLLLLQLLRVLCSS